MRLEALKYLYDIRKAAGLLNEFVRDKTFADYQSDAMLRAAVEREFEIIGEAMTKLARVDEAVIARISEFKRIIAFRNVLIHEYADETVQLCRLNAEVNVEMRFHSRVVERCREKKVDLTATFKEKCPSKCVDGHR